MKVWFRIIKFFARLTWLIIAIVVLLALSFHFWFIHHSEKTIEDLIAWQSGGKLKAIIKKFKIDYVNNRINIKDLTIVNTDSTERSASYHFNTKDFHLSMRTRWDLFFHKELLIDSIIFNAPVFVVTRTGTAIHDTSTNKLQLAEELGNIYKTISQSLAVLNLQRLEINEGSVLVRDAEHMNKPPLLLSHIFFSIDKFNIDSGSASNKSSFIFSERVLLRITNQRIRLRDNNGSLSFKELVIDSKEKQVLIKGPHIDIIPGKEQKNSFAFTADMLNISGLDFNALYQQQYIHADSVFTLNPKGNLDIFSNEKSSQVKKTKRVHDFNSLRQLPVAINISHIVMQHGDVAMRLHKADKTTSFQTKNDNLSITGFRLSDTAKNILNIDGFNYTLRNYVGYTPDSVYSFHFDSLQFMNNKVVLHHFTSTTVKKNQTGLTKDYTVPKFEITGFDWFSFIFDNHFKAKSAVLYHPVLNLVKNNLPVTQNNGRQQEKKSIYQLLSVLDNMLDLDALKILSASFHMNRPGNLDIQLQNLNLDININQLTAAKSVDQIVHAVSQLSFDTATVTNPAVSAHIYKAGFSNTDQSLLLENVLVNSAGVNAAINGVALTNLSFDNNTIEVNDIKWTNGFIHIHTTEETAGKAMPEKKVHPALLVNHIAGSNTALHFDNKKISAAVFLTKISANSLTQVAEEPFNLEGLALAGNNASLHLSNSAMHFTDFSIQDNKRSTVTQLFFEEKTKTDSVRVTAPQLSFIPFIRETARTKTFTADSVNLPELQAFFSSQNKSARLEKKQSVALPAMHIKNLSVTDASVRYVSADAQNKIAANCGKLSIAIKDMATVENQNLTLNSVATNMSAITLIKNDSISFKSEGNVYAATSLFSYYPATAAWQIQVNKLYADSIHYAVKSASHKNTALTLEAIRIENITASDNALKKPLPWLINTSNADVMITDLHWQSSNADLKISDFHFNQPKRQITLKAFSIDPGKSREDFIRQLVYRKDFMQATSGELQMDGIELKDGLWHIPRIHINNPVLNIYSDKLKPAGAASIQPLPVSALKSLGPELLADVIQLNNMTVRYTELNADTRRTGQVYFTHINGDIKNISSRPVADSLHVNVNAKFLDTMQLHLVLSESYTDPLSGLSLQLQLGRGDLRLLNTFLAPLVSVKAQSGYLDTMTMRSFGNEYLSHGEMHLYYHDLKAVLLDSGNTQQQRPGKKLLSFFANVLAIRSSNVKRYADFNFIRFRQRSSISYLLTMVVQGAAKNVAPLSRIIYRKQYKTQLKNPDLQGKF